MARVRGVAQAVIISQTPYRVSFAGGTDLPAFYRRESGAVLRGLKVQNSSVSCDLRIRRPRRYGDAT